jgi:hypothetical protein
VLGTPGNSGAIIGERNPVGIGAASTQTSLKRCGFWRTMIGFRGAALITCFPASGKIFAIATLGRVSF